MATKLDFSEIAGEELWNQHEQNRQDILAMMKESQKLADRIRIQIKGIQLNSSSSKETL
jgi:hypothetical protein